MRRALVLLGLLVSTAAAQVPEGVRVYGAGGPATFGDVLAAVEAADVVFVGELHDDSTAHVLERLLFTEAVRRSPGRPVALGLEMFETDVQTVLDEYLAGLIRERDFLVAARPWTNYEADYRPLVEAARAAGAPVVATNVPGRYASLLSRRGPASLDSLSAAARAWLPPEVAPASEALAAKFTALMGGAAHGSGPSVEGMLAAQTLRDATMAWRIAETLARTPGVLVVHVNGSFHSAGRLGVPEHLARLAPEARVVVVTMDRVEDPGVAPEVEGDDFVVLTPAAAPAAE